MTPKGDHKKILNVLNRAVRRRVVNVFCRERDIGSTTLYGAVDPETGNPTLETLCRVVNALGYQLYVRPKKGAKGPMEGYPKLLSDEADAELGAEAAQAMAQA